MLVHVVHNDRDRDTRRVLNFETVAVLNLPNELEDRDALELAYELTNNIDTPWVVTCPQYMTPKGSAAARRGCRSTSVGDEVILYRMDIGTTARYRCDSVGWKLADEYIPAMAA